MTHCSDGRTTISQLSVCSALSLFVDSTSMKSSSAYLVKMAIVALSYKYDTNTPTARKWTGRICRSDGNFPAMNWLIYEVPSKIGAEKFWYTPKVKRACRFPN